MAVLIRGELPQLVQGGAGPIDLPAGDGYLPQHDLPAQRRNADQPERARKYDSAIQNTIAACTGGDWNTAHAQHVRVYAATYVGELSDKRLLTMGGHVCNEHVRRAYVSMA